MTGPAASLDEILGAVVIVGAGQAGGRCAEALRAAGFAGRIALVGKEVYLPYERPSLSKEMLVADDDAAIAWVRPEWAYAEEDIELRLGLAAVSIDRDERKVVLEDGSALPYDALVLATGARVRMLNAPGADRAPIHVIRTIDDSRALRARLSPGTRVAVIGGGFIGLEVAAAARQRGADVVVFEAADRLMARAVPPEISEHHADLHRLKGVDIRLETTVTSMTCQDEATALETSNGETLLADVVVVGVGIEPNDELAREAGLETNRGVVVDAFGRTSDPRIFAAGDVARHYNPLLERHILLESWQNAQNQAIAVAKVIAGGGAAYAEIPWFWSDQFGVNLQMVGLPDPDTRTIVRGAPGQGPSLLLQTKGGRVVSACALDAPRELRFAKELIASRAVFDESMLADPNTRLGDVVREVKQKKVPA